jgi:SPP1 family predicted phage head-tail adaptor
VKCCEITAGMLREPIALQREVSEDDDFGGQVKEFQTFANTKAYVKPLSGREAVFGMQLEGRLTHRIYMRYRADLHPKDRIVIRGEPVQVRSVINLELRNKWLEVLCEEGVAT